MIRTIEKRRRGRPRGSRPLFVEERAGRFDATGLLAKESRRLCWRRPPRVARDRHLDRIRSDPRAAPPFAGHDAAAAARWRTALARFIHEGADFGTSAL